MTNEDFLKRISLILDDGVDCFPNLIEHTKRLITVSEAAEKYKIYLPNMDLIGAAKYSDHLKKAMELREALSQLEEK